MPFKIVRNDITKVKADVLVNTGWYSVMQYQPIVLLSGNKLFSKLYPFFQFFPVFIFFFEGSGKWYTHVWVANL